MLYANACSIQARASAVVISVELATPISKTSIRRARRSAALVPDPDILDRRALQVIDQRTGR